MTKNQHYAEAKNILLHPLKGKDMQITLNGKPTKIELKDGKNILVLLREIEVKKAEYISVELNGNIIEREQFQAVPVKDGDRMEIFHYMGGG